MMIKKSVELEEAIPVPQSKFCTLQTKPVFVKLTFGKSPSLIMNHTRNIRPTYEAASDNNYSRYKKVLYK